MSAVDDPVQPPGGPVPAGEENLLRCTWRSGPFGLSQLGEVTESFRQWVDWGDVIAIQAPMGTGKTTFVAALAKTMGAIDDATSPTFALCQEYPVQQGLRDEQRMLRHLDLYRINGESELRDLGWDELMEDGRALTLVEWPERAADHFPEYAKLLRLERQPDGLRLAALWERESV